MSNLLDNLKTLTGIEWDFDITGKIITTENEEFKDIDINLEIFEDPILIDDLFNTDSDIITRIVELKEKQNDITKDYVKIILTNTGKYIAISVSELPMIRLKIKQYFMLGQGVCFIGVLN
jgi:hypothetical protein